MYGIPEKSYRLILNSFKDFEQIEKVAIYGSRAMGNYIKGSDIDLVLYGKNLNQNSLLKLKTKLEQELPIPFYFDITHYESLPDNDLKKHIDNYSKKIYPL